MTFFFFTLGMACVGSWLGLGVCHRGFHLMHDIKHSMSKLQIVWNVDDCYVPFHAHFRWGVALVEKFNYWALLTLSWDPPFRYKEY